VTQSLLVIEHEADSGASMLGERFRHHGFALDVRVPVKRNLPSTAEGYVAVLSLGASPSVNDADAAWWLDPHLGLLRDADARQIPIFGVCFGAQALAVALG
jgi:GMP synthase (glutamine-hydrolysing)